MRHKKLFVALLRIFTTGSVVLFAIVAIATGNSAEKSCYNPNDGFDTVFVDCSKKENEKCESLQDLRARGKSNYACYCQNVVENKTYTADCPSYIQSTVTQMVKNSKIIDVKNNRMPASISSPVIEASETPATEK